MSHEVIQVIILVKYLKRSHEMIKIKYKYLLTMVNKEEDKSKHLHEMKRFWNQIAIWSSLHKLVLIYGSSHGSVFKSPLYRVHSEHESGSGSGLLLPVRIARTGPKCCNKQPNSHDDIQHIRTHNYTLTHVHMHIRVPVSYTHLTLPTIYSV